MATRVYHWKHGWIPLTHAAALSKAHGSHAGAARILGQVHPVPQSHLPRSAHVVAGHDGLAHFAVLDKRSGHTARLTEAEALSIHETGRSITGVNEHGTVTTTLGNDLSRADDAALVSALGDLAAKGDYGPRFEQIAAELDRRDNHATTPTVPSTPDPVAEQAALERLLFGDRSQSRDLTQSGSVKRRDPEKVLRDEYDTWVHTQWLRAEEQTRGKLLSREGQRALDRGEFGITDLFTRKRRSLEYASPELQQWFAEHGNQRMSFPEFRAGRMDDKKARQASWRLRNRGWESEYG